MRASIDNVSRSQLDAVLLDVVLWLEEKAGCVSNEKGKRLEGRWREKERVREGKRKQEVSFSLSVSKDCIGKSTLALSGSIQREAFINYVRVMDRCFVCVCLEGSKKRLYVTLS